MCCATRLRTWMPKHTEHTPREHWFALTLQDAPGTWTKHMHETHAIPFYYNKETGRSQFMTPPSCAWSKAMLDGHPVYTNSITHQALWRRPPALSWKLLHAPGDRESYAVPPRSTGRCAASCSGHSHSLNSTHTWTCPHLCDAHSLVNFVL